MLRSGVCMARDLPLRPRSSSIAKPCLQHAQSPGRPPVPPGCKAIPHSASTTRRAPTP